MDGEGDKDGRWEEGIGRVLKGYWGEEKGSEWKGKSGCGKG